MKTLVVSAHPDDEILGLGGSLAYFRDQGHECYWVIATQMSPGKFSAKQIADRNEEIKRVDEQLKFKKVFKLNYNCAELTDENRNGLIADFGKIIKECGIENLYLPFYNDAHSDHRLVFESAMSCTKSFRYPTIKRVLMYECISETEFGPHMGYNQFNPQYFIDISKYLTEKNNLMKIYSSELGEHPFPRSLKNIEALATIRGATAGCVAAEAFQILKWIEKDNFSK